MIFVQRDAANKPADLAAVAAQLALDMDAALKVDEKLTVSKYWSQRRDELKPYAIALAEVFKWKCGFCEATMSAVANPQIEHYRPKGMSQFKSLVFEWDNWVLACPLCNQNKSTPFPLCAGVPCLLDPTVDTPSTHLFFVDERISFKTERGDKTITKIKLDRGPLEASRALWRGMLDALLLLAIEPATYQAARTMLIWCMQDDAPFSAMAFAYLVEKVPRLARPVSPHARIVLADPVEQIRALVAANASLIVSLI